MENQLSRRKFIGGAFLAGAGVAAAGALSACSGGNAKTAAKETPDISWDKEADVVIVGGGAAGLWAAVKAADNGLSAIVLEKQPEDSAGGDMRCSGGWLLPVSTDPKVMLSTGSFGEANEDLVYAVDELGTEAIDYFIDEGYMKWADQPYTVVEGQGPAVYKGQLAAAQDAGAEILYETPGVSLITNDDKEVIGVVAGSEDSPINVKAKYAVLLATGSYTVNTKLMANFHIPGMEYASDGSPYLEGDGLVMAGELGAQLSKLPKGYEVGYLASKAASEEVGTGVMCVPPSTNSVVIVNQDGERFVDEFTSWTHNKSTLPVFDFDGDMMVCRSDAAQYVNNKMFEIVDENTFKSCSLGNMEAGYSWAVFMPESVGGYQWSENNQAELQKGWIIKGDTVADIASKIDVDAATLQKSIDDYNAACAAGNDQFRAASTLAPIGAGPYYAIELIPSIIYSIGGLTTDENGRTLTWRDEPIPRLYSAGNVGQVITYLQPIGLNGCWGEAAVAINDIADNLDPWDEQ